MPHGFVEDLCFYEIAGCPLIFSDGSTLGIIEGIKRHRGGCEVLLVTTEDGREIKFPIYEQIIVEFRPYDCLIVNPPKDLMKLYLEGVQPRNLCDIVEREVAAYKMAEAV